MGNKIVYECTECYKQYEKYTSLCEPCLGARVEKKFIGPVKQENKMDKKRAVGFVYSVQKRLGAKDQATKQNFIDLVDLLKKGLPNDGQDSLF